MNVRSLMRCSFCGANSREARKIVSSEDGRASICDACVLQCTRVLAFDPGLSEKEKRLWTKRAAALSHILERKPD